METQTQDRTAVRRVLAETIRRQCASDWLAFCRVCLPQHFSLPSAGFHREIADQIKANQYNAVAAPREHAKSTTFNTGYALWEATHNPRAYIVIVGNNYECAQEFLRDIKTVVESGEEYRAIYGDLVGKEIWREGYIQLANGAIIRSVGRLARIRGLKQGGRRPTLVILDDIEDEESVLSRETTRKITAWIKGTVMGLGQGCAVLFLGTILANTAVLAHFTDPTQEPAWTKKIYSCHDGKDEIGTPLWDEKWPAKALEKKRYDLADDYAWWAEWMNRPTGSGLTPFLVDEMYTYYDEDLPRIEGIVQSVDLSSGNGTDYFSHWTLGLGNDNRIYVLDHTVDKFEFDEQAAFIRKRTTDTLDGATVDYLVIDSIAYQESMAQHLENKVLCPIYRYKASGNKQLRIRSLLPWYKHGKLVFPHAAPWMQAFKDEISFWRPVDGLRDDQLDSLEMGVRAISRIWGVSSQDGDDEVEDAA